MNFLLFNAHYFRVITSGCGKAMTITILEQRIVVVIVAEREIEMRQMLLLLLW